MNTIEQTLDYRVEQLSPENLVDVGRLHTAVYGGVPPAGFFLKKYDTAFTGVSHTGFIAYNQERVAIAFYGVIPCFITFKGDIILSAQSADTMTHPSYQKKGLFIDLARRTFDLCKSLGIRLLFGFPNQNSLPGFVNKLDWEATERMDCFIIQTGASAFRRAFNKFLFLKKHLDAYRHRVLQKYVTMELGIPNSVTGEGFTGVLRDINFLLYKTYNPTYTIKLAGATLWIKVGRVLLIGDIALNNGSFPEMTHELNRLASRLGIAEINFHSSPGTTLHGLFTNEFNAIPSFPVIFKDISGGINLEDIKFTSADIDTF